MKKILWAVCLVFSVFVFAGCGVEGSSQPSAVRFVKDVFYVDCDVETRLEYEVYPSTAKDYSVQYTLTADESELSYFSFSNGIVKVLNDNFESIRVNISVGSLSHSCEVRLREYPTKVGFYDVSGEEATPKKQDTVFAGLIYPLDLMGQFGDQLRGVKNGEFVYKIESSNPSVISIEDEQRLLVKSTGRRGSSRVTVTVCNSLGEEQEGLFASIDLMVVQAIGESFATFDDSLVLKDNLTINLTTQIGKEYLINVRYFDGEGFLIDVIGFYCHLTNNDVFEKVEKDGQVYLRVKGEGKVNLTIQSSGTNSDGKPVKISCDIEVQILE